MINDDLLKEFRYLYYFSGSKNNQIKITLFEFEKIFN